MNQHSLISPGIHSGFMLTPICNRGKLLKVGCIEVGKGFLNEGSRHSQDNIICPFHGIPGFLVNLDFFGRQIDVAEVTGVMVEFTDVFNILSVSQPPADLDIGLFTQDFDKCRGPASSSYDCYFCMI
jgi:hypothetical protein